MRGLLGPFLLSLLLLAGAGCSLLRPGSAHSQDALPPAGAPATDVGTDGRSGASAEGVGALAAAKFGADEGMGTPGSLGLAGNEEEWVDDGGGEDSEDEATEVEEEAESHEVAPTHEREDMRYTADLSDAELERLWKSSPEALGTLSLGFVDEGRLINAESFPPDGDGWVVVSPHNAFATQETIDYLLRAIREVHTRYPTSAPLRVNQLSGKEGGYLRPHKSHQNGRDVDLGFYYFGDRVVRVRARERYMDPARNWALVKALVTLTDVQFILVDHRVQKVLYQHALSTGEDKAWLDTLFKGGKKALIRHARRHRDHFHVRFYNARAQELGRRVTPFLAMRPEQNVTPHRVRKGDTLGGIARRYGSSVSAIKKANRLKSSFLRTSRVLRIPLRGPCTRCPVPPAVVLPERRLPPGLTLPPELLARPMPRPPLATQAALAARTDAPAAGTPGGEAAGGSAPVGRSPEVVTASGTSGAVEQTGPAVALVPGGAPEAVVHPASEVLSQEGSVEALVSWRDRLYRREFVLPRMLRAGSLLRQVYGVPE